MNNFQLIAFAGPLRSGKTQSALYLTERYKARRFSIAYYTKRLAKKSFKFSDRQIFDDLKDVIDVRYGLTPRTTFTRLGEGAKEIFGQDVWIDKCLAEILEYVDQNSHESPLVVIDDVRFVHEVDKIKQVGGHVIFLKRSDIPLPPDSAGSHISETALSGLTPDTFNTTFKYSLENGLNDLHKLIDNYCRLSLRTPTISCPVCKGKMYKFGEDVPSREWGLKCDSCDGMGFFLEPLT